MAKSRKLLRSYAAALPHSLPPLIVACSDESGKRYIGQGFKNGKYMSYRANIEQGELVK